MGKGRPGVFSGFMPSAGSLRARAGARGAAAEVSAHEGTAHDTSKRRYLDFRRSYRRKQEPGSENGAAGSVLGGWRYFGEYRRLVGRHTGALVLVFSLAAVAKVLGLVLPYATKLIIDDVLLKDGMSRAEQNRLLTLFAVAMVALMLLQQAIEAYRGYRMTVLNARLIFRLRHKS